MSIDIVQDAIFNRPLEKVELPDGGFDGTPRIVGDGDSIPAAKGVQAALTIGLQLQLVIVIDLETRGVGLLEDGIVFLGVIGYEPVDDAEGNLGLAVDDPNHLIEIFLALIEFHQVV